MTTWTPITKPSGKTWTNVQKPTSSWSKINKASNTSWTALAKPTARSGNTINLGSPIGLLLALTYAVSISGGGGWTSITKAVGRTWTAIPKAL